MVKKMQKNSLIWIAVTILTVIFLMGLVSAATVTVCAAGCNYTTVQVAIDAASSGDIVAVGAGSYQGDLVINKTLTLQGDSRTNTTILRNTSTSQVVLIQANNVTISNIKIDGGALPSLVSNLVKLSNTGAPYNNTEVSDSHLLRSKGAAIHFYGDSPAITTGNSAIINDNIIEYYAGDSCDSGGCQYRGIAIGRILNIEIRRNLINNSNSWEYRSDNLSSGGYAIYVKDYSSGYVEDNTISKCFYGIIVNSNVDEMWVDNNTISECHRGIVLGEVFAKVHITNNVISTRQDSNIPVDSKNVNEQGILLGGDGDWYDSSPPYPYQVNDLGHEVSGNIVTGTATTDSFGLGAMPGWWDKDYGVSGVFTDNVVSGYKYGIKVWGTHTPWAGTSEDLSTSVNLSFTNNSITGTYYAVVDSVWSGSLDVTSNWWGTASPNANKFNNTYIYYPFCLDVGCSDGIEDKIQEFSGSTTDFSIVTDWSAVNLVLDASSGKVDWSSNVDLSSSSLLFDDYVTISHNFIGIDTSSMPELNQSAVLTFRSTGIMDANHIGILKDGVVCPASICTNIGMGGYSGGTVTVTVSQFSNYTVYNQRYTNADLKAIVEDGLGTIGAGFVSWLDVVVLLLVLVFLAGLIVKGGGGGLGSWNFDLIKK